MPERLDYLVERLSSEGQKTVEFFRLLTAEQLEQTLYVDGSRWKVRQLLAHFVTAEEGIQKLIEGVLAGGEGVAENFDINLFNERHVARLIDTPLEELMQRFDAVRQASIQLVDKMTPPDLLRTGRHPYLGIAPLEEMLKLLYRHNQIHQRDVRKLLNSVAE